MPTADPPTPASVSGNWCHSNDFHSQGVERGWQPGFDLDLGRALGPLRRGGGDPTCRPDRGAWWRTSTTPDGPATLAIRAEGRAVVATAWGAGAEHVLAGLPALLGAADDDRDFIPLHPLIAEARRRMPGLRLTATGRVWDVLVPAILEQKVTGREAWRSWRELCWRFGSAAPGPAPDGMRVLPTPAQLRAIPDWDWHRAGVDGARRRALLAVASVAHRLEDAVALRGDAGRALLRKVPGIGVWTAAEVAQRAWGDADAVSFGDFHLPATVGWALTGAPVDDDGLAELLAPYAPQRQRAVRYVEVSGFRKPRFGPRFAGRNYRSW